MSASNGLGFWSGLRHGLAASLEVHEPPQPLEPRSAEQSMRGDWTRIGEDFKVVIAGGAHGFNQVPPKVPRIKCMGVERPNYSPNIHS